MSHQTAPVNLYQHSIQIIKQNQSESGAYVASPNFPTYYYCWFRDGAFTAYAMDLAGEHESAGRFHNWASGVIGRYAHLVNQAISKASQKQPLGQDFLPTRFDLHGKISADANWPNFQLDGFGTWLWVLREHQRLVLSHSELPSKWLYSANLVADYLTALWNYPCYDCWEEFPELVHPHTLAAIYGGLVAHHQMTGQDHDATLTAIRERLLSSVDNDGKYFVKFNHTPYVDASLLGLSTPYGVVAPNDPKMVATVEQIESTLRRGAGVHRYVTDTYYGGGEWILLTAWLGWYYCQLAEQSPTQAVSLIIKAQELISWVEKQAGDGEQTGWLSEQTQAYLNDPSFYDHWAARWGKVANPLLWSHANYIILTHALEKSILNTTP